jgi:hypothetical protein
MKSLVGGFLVLGGLLAVACGEDDKKKETPAASPTAGTETKTFSSVSSIISANCGCHSGDIMASAAAVKTKGAATISATIGTTMPKGNPGKISAADSAALKDWLANGTDLK